MPTPRVIFISADAARPGATGKMRCDFFLPIFSRALAERGIEMDYVPDPWSFLKAPPPPSGSVIIPIYNEERAGKQASSPAVIAFTRAIEAKTRFLSRRCILANRVRTGRIISDKSLANRVLSRANVLMPRLITAPKSEERTFSNANVGTEMPGTVVSPGDEIDRARYNTKFIDTIHEFRGFSYYVALRALCVGPRPIAIFPRVRPVSDGDPSVHAKDTPLDPDLLNDVYEKTVAARRSEINSICQKIFDVLGFGFYAHDLLPERETGNTYLCETGFKFDTGFLRPIQNKLIFERDISTVVIRRSAFAVADKVLGKTNGG